VVVVAVTVGAAAVTVGVAAVTVVAAVVVADEAAAAAAMATNEINRLADRDTKSIAVGSEPHQI
jgi:hypothetical protein